MLESGGVVMIQQQSNLIHTRDKQLILSIVTVLSRQRPGQGEGLCPWGLKGHWGMGEPSELNRNNRVTKQ